MPVYFCIGGRSIERRLQIRPLGIDKMQLTCGFCHLKQTAMIERIRFQNAETLLEDFPPIAGTSRLLKHGLRTGGPEAGQSTPGFSAMFFPKRTEQALEIHRARWIDQDTLREHFDRVVNIRSQPLRTDFKTSDGSSAFRSGELDR
ncbi:MAG: hypothetical protein ACKOCN_06110 [Planctomycetaceae bacterium]